MIDIGSNSVRLVVYEGPARAPIAIHNEKVTASLGRGLAEDGRLDAKSMMIALAGLQRFALLTRAMGLDAITTVATAAVREASNGGEFLRLVAATGLEPRILSGEEEATASARGILAAFPHVDGIVGDLGGGSLELADVKDGRIGRRDSLPLGVLRIPAIRSRGPRALDRRLAKLLKGGWKDKGAKRPFYLIGGSWRALAHIDMHQSGWPLFDPHGYRMSASRALRLVRVIAHMDTARLRAIPGVPNARVATLPDAAALLAALLRKLGSDCAIVSSSGLREGLLYADLTPAERSMDPLLVGVAGSAVGGGDAGAGDTLHRWIEPVFGTDPAGLARLRHAACFVSGAATHPGVGNPAKAALQRALYGDLAGVDGRGRAMIANAVYVSRGGKGSPPALAKLCDAEGLACAARWGHAIRLAVSLDGGAARLLDKSDLAFTEGRLLLGIDPDFLPLYGDEQRKNHATLAATLDAEPKMRSR